MNATHLPAALAASLFLIPLSGQQPSAQEPAAAIWTDAQQRGVDFLAGHQKDGVFSVEMRGRSFPDPGFTSLAIAAMQSKPKAKRTDGEQAIIDQGLAWVLTQQNDDGSFGRNVPNYTTCAAVMALSRWHDEAKAKDALAKAQKYVIKIQNSEANGSSPSDLEYGGVGYGGRGERSDLSNMQFSIQALRQTGLPANDDAFRRALVFLQRTQNLRSVNDQSGKIEVTVGEAEKAKFAAGDDGGAVYYPGESPAGYVVHPDGTATPRSYGSMTYALLKTYTLCGVDGDDPRVVAAVDWIGKHWTVTENPGADPKADPKTRYQGLFYYYMLMAQALDAVGIDEVATAGGGGEKRGTDWRAELKQQLESMQKEDGSWLNDENDRWYEGLDILCTCYALLALEHC